MPQQLNVLMNSGTQFDFCVVCKEHVLAFDVSMDDTILVKMGQALKWQECSKETCAYAWLTL